jgi:D-tyrosyl-tRNA(Tyr) deacylase
MRVIIQRVSSAFVSIDKKVHNAIGNGLLVLVGFEESDSSEDIQWISKKIVDLRIFSDLEGKMNLSIKEIQGELLVVSQFTLFASTKKGNRPSFIRSAKPETAIPLYESFLSELALLHSTPIKTGVFGADMQVSLVNDGPVTISIDSKNRE